MYCTVDKLLKGADRGEDHPVVRVRTPHSSNGFRYLGNTETHLRESQHVASVAPRIPQEIIDEILDNLVGGTFSTLSCSTGGV